MITSWRRRQLKFENHSDGKKIITHEAQAQATLKELLPQNVHILNNFCYILRYRPSKDTRTPLVFV